MPTVSGVDFDVQFVLMPTFLKELTFRMLPVEDLQGFDQPTATTRQRTFGTKEKDDVYATGISVWHLEMTTAITLCAVKFVEQHL